MHTGWYTLESFFRAAREAGLDLVEATERKVKGEDRQREWDVRRADIEDDNNDERERRRWVVWSALKWRELYAPPPTGVLNAIGKQCCA